ncbi:MAG: hypothetical protein FWE11_08475 [Defluviitaleaceae bacterium]|nr:hypothetical protein [Defluviitaleaceae bacterium]
MKPLKTSPTLKDLIPPLSMEEYQSLEENLLAQGCRDTIKTWQGTIIDGHNRYAICQKHNLNYTTKNLHFSTKKDATLWIIQNQLGRRNLTNAMRIKLALQQEDLLHEKANLNRKGNIISPVHFHKAIAQISNTSEQTVQRYMRIREIGTSEQLQQVERGEKKIGTVYRELEITSRITQEFHNNTPDINNPIGERSVTGNIEKLTRLYNFMLAHYSILLKDNDISRIIRYLSRQTKMLQSMGY